MRKWPNKWRLIFQPWCDATTGSSIFAVDRVLRLFCQGYMIEVQMKRVALILISFLAALMAMLPIDTIELKELLNKCWMTHDGMWWHAQEFKNEQEQR